MRLSDIHNHILQNSETVGSRHFLEENQMKYALLGYETYVKFYTEVALNCRQRNCDLDEMSGDDFYNLLLTSAEKAAEKIAPNSTPEARLSGIVSNYDKDVDFALFDDVEHGLFLIH